MDMMLRRLPAVGLVAVFLVGAVLADEALMQPSALAAKAPDTFQAKFETAKGSFVIEVQRAWAPLGADRFYNLVDSGFYDGVAFFRVVEGFVVQFGIHGDPKVAGVWKTARIADDPVVESNKRGMVTYAKPNRPNSRTTQVFINFADNSRLDSMGFAPFGKVVEGMEVVDSLHKSYGERAAANQDRIQTEGNDYLKVAFPELDYVKKATIVRAVE
jgi:peptidyl-prolyl cis-trans isomerase A (cyclophilin A)